MEHEEAIKNLAAERYLLGELTESDREAYEEHLFSCPACFEQVKAGTEFVGHLRRIGVEEAAAGAAPASSLPWLGTICAAGHDHGIRAFLLPYRASLSTRTR